MRFRVSLGLVALVLTGVVSAQSPLAPAFSALTASSLLAHIKVLSSDEFEGRAPGSKGEELTVKYLSSEFGKLGLGPGNPNGTWIQEVPLVGIRSTSGVSVAVKGNPLTFATKTDIVLSSRRTVPVVSTGETDVVFVGYGVVAPEFGWDDYKGVDVKGKTIVMLINDPPVASAGDPSTPDPAVFKGKAMTYYGRWTYKYEIASDKGAAAALIVHETGPAGYPWEVVSGSWGGENFDLRRADGYKDRVAVEGWITDAKTKELLEKSGLDFATLKRAAAQKDFRPVTLTGARATFEVKNTMRDVASRNVIARLEGSDPKLKNEYVLYSAHWDHLGRDTTLSGDQIFNGAVDNASGTAQLLEIAAGFRKLPTPPRRSVLFLAVTAEEQGLLGAKYYAEHPLYPLEKTLANINMDSANVLGRTSDIVIVGLGNSTLDDIATDVAREQGRVIVPDPEPEKGYFYRSDHFELAKLGVPALYADGGVQVVGKPTGWGQQQRDDYTARDYHKVSDEVKADWDLAGAIEDARFFLAVGYRVTASSTWPEWKPGTEFRARRESMLGKGSRE